MEHILSCNDIDFLTTQITKIILNAVSKTIINKGVTIRPNDVPWFNTNIRKLIRTRKRLQKKLQKQKKIQIIIGQNLEKKTK